MMKYWEDMSEEEKSEICRNSDCPYYYGEIDACMYDEVVELPFEATDTACYQLKRRMKA